MTGLWTAHEHGWLHPDAVTERALTVGQNSAVETLSGEGLATIERRPESFRKELVVCFQECTPENEMTREGEVIRIDVTAAAKLSGRVFKPNQPVQE